VRKLIFFVCLGVVPMTVPTRAVLRTLALIGLLAALAPAGEPPPTSDETYPQLEKRLRPMAREIGESEWLRHHPESGQTFAEYLQADPVRRGRKLSTIYLCLLGDFNSEQQRVLDVTRDYLEIFFQVPVKVHKRVRLKDVPERARRVHPQWKVPQVLSTYVLDDVLRPERPDDALAYLCFTANDLWPGEGWNFVLGQASLRQRVGVWSIYRNGDPARDEDNFRLCLRRTLSTASHETGHILTMQHCTAFACNMNGANSLEEGDRAPLHLCPVCLRKLCWNLQVEPVAYLRQLQAFCARHGLKDEAGWYEQAVGLLEKKD
jgi:archaemetzincin